MTRLFDEIIQRMRVPGDESMRSTLMQIGEVEHASRRAERKRNMDKWDRWEKLALPEGLPDARADSWTRDIRYAYRNNIFAVLCRPMPGGAVHAMISTLPGGAEPTWAEKQKIKDMLFGGRWAVECFPPRDRIIDGANAYHLWVLPEGASWGFDLTLGRQPVTGEP